MCNCVCSKLICNVDYTSTYKFIHTADCTTVVILLENRRWPCGLGMNIDSLHSGMHERNWREVQI